MKHEFMIKKSLMKTNVKTCHKKKRNHNDETLKTYDSIELTDFWRYWNMFSVDQNRSNITKKTCFRWLCEIWLILWTYWNWLNWLIMLCSFQKWNWLILSCCDWFWLNYQCVIMFRIDRCLHLILLLFLNQ